MASDLTRQMPMSSAKPNHCKRGEIELGEPCFPLLSQAAIDYFESLLRPGFIICEYGSGAGTIWLAQRVGKVISIEHCPLWFRAVGRELDRLGLDVDYHLVSPAETGDQKAAIEAYTVFIQQFPDAYFDLVFLDGWRPSRPRAPGLAMSKVKPLGWVIIDDIEWTPVRDGIEAAALTGWEKARFGGPAVGYDPKLSLGPVACCTGFYQRPRENLRSGGSR